MKKLIMGWLKCLFLTSFYILMLGFQVYGDLPTHCMLKDFVGQWDVMMTTPVLSKEGNDIYSDKDVCGHNRPDDFKKSIKDKDSYDHWWWDRLEEKPKGTQVEKLRLCVEKANGDDAKICRFNGGVDDPCTSQSQCSNVTFTLIYDEGVLLSLDNIFEPGVDVKVVLFFKYEPVNNQGKLPGLSHLKKYKSLCGDTVSGFWTTTGNKVVQDDKIYRGCAVAKKTSKVDPHSSEPRSEEKNEILKDQEEDKKFLIHGVEHGSGLAAGALESTGAGSLQEQGSHAKVVQRARTRDKARMRSFLDSKFQVSESFVEKLNAANLGWTASLDAVKDMVDSYSYAEALSRLGVSAVQRLSEESVSYYRTRYLEMTNQSSASSSLEGEMFRLEQDTKMEDFAKFVETKALTASVETDEDKKEDTLEMKCALEHLPRSFDWTNETQTGCPGVVEPAGDQGRCGSCYAFATARAATSRVRIARHPSDKCSAGGKGEEVRDEKILNTTLSPQSIVECSYANQGCDGGYSLLAAQHTYAEGLFDSKCDPYKDQLDPNPTCGERTGCKKYVAKDFGYTGGIYGYEISMHDMMLDMIANGPLPVAIYATPELQVYKDGVFRALWNVKRNTKIDGTSGWVKTNHAVLAVGWDEVDDPKCKVKGQKQDCKGKLPVWKIQNSWGKHWGMDGGFFYLPRGENRLAVESLPVSMIFSDTPSVVAQGPLEKYKSCVASSS